VIAGPGTTEAVGPMEVLAFWRAAGPDKWYEKDAAFDAEIAARFSCLWQTGRDGKLAPWEETPEGALALVIVLDQFPRNMFRGDRRAYETDGVARSVADRAIGRGFDRQVSHVERQFFYLPFQHSENLADQERCLALARGYGDDEFTKYAERHADIIRRFGRFPHRNATLGRATRPQELPSSMAAGLRADGIAWGAGAPRSIKSPSPHIERVLRSELRFETCGRAWPTTRMSGNFRPRQPRMKI
jgi:uncharacterized protein (DUF924 family)